MKVTDGQLVEQARGGDKNAFGELVDRYRDMVYGLGYHLTGNFEDARDLAQEAFVQGFLKLSQLRAPEKFSSWLRQIALNVHRMRRRSPALVTMPIDEEIEMTPRHEPSEIETVVHEALAKLREPERLALTLHYINGYTQSEIGGFLGVQPATVKTRLARARQHLKKEIMAMVEDTFDKKKLPEEFTKDVISAVENLVGDMRATLIKNINEKLRLNRHEVNEKWRNILAKMPAELLPRPLKEQGEAHQINVASLPKDLRKEIRDAQHQTWFNWIFGAMTEDLPWIRNFDVLWIKFCETEGKSYVWLANVPGNFGTMINFGIDADDSETRPLKSKAPAKRPGSDSLVSEFMCAIAALPRIIPCDADALRAALYASSAANMRQAKQMLPAAALKIMKTGKSVHAQDLPEQVHKLIREAAFMHWGSMLLRTVLETPSWLRSLQKGRIEFGLYPNEKGLPEIMAGSEYVKFCGPDGDTSGVMQFGISEQFDKSGVFNA